LRALDIEITWAGTEIQFDGKLGFANSKKHVLSRHYCGFQKFKKLGFGGEFMWHIIYYAPKVS
jgi:hypothetical protein